MWSAGAPPRPPVSDTIGRCRILRSPSPIPSSGPLGCPATRLGRIVAASALDDSSIARAVVSSGGPSPCGRLIRRGHRRMVSSATARQAITGPIRADVHQPTDFRRERNVCAAHRIVRQAAVLNTNQANPVPGDPTGDLAVAANARLALYSGGDYLLRRLTAEPATPAELRDAVRSLANALQELAVNYLAGAPDSVVTPLRLALERDTRAVDPLCV